MIITIKRVFLKSLINLLTVINFKLFKGTKQKDQIAIKVAIMHKNLLNLNLKLEMLI